MSSPDPDSLSSSTRGTALFIARVIFYNGLLMGTGLFAAAVAVVFFKVGALADMERWLVGAVFLGLGIMAFGFAWTGKGRVAKLKGNS